jgi:hypothetical protein
VRVDPIIQVMYKFLMTKIFTKIMFTDKNHVQINDSCPLAQNLL